MSFFFLVCVLILLLLIKSKNIFVVNVKGGMRYHTKLKNFAENIKNK